MYVATYVCTCYLSFVCIYIDYDLCDDDDDDNEDKPEALHSLKDGKGYFPFTALMTAAKATCCIVLR